MFASYNPQNDATADTNETETGFGATYTGVEGLTFSYATTDINSGATATSGDHTAMKATYAYGPVTVGYSKNEHDVSASGANNTDLTSWNVAYTISDELSIAYGTEDLSVNGKAEDAEFTAVVVAYTSGGMTITGKMEDAENVDGTANTSADQEMWTVSAAFAF